MDLATIAPTCDCIFKETDLLSPATHSVGGMGRGNATGTRCEPPRNAIAFVRYEGRKQLHAI